MPKVGAQEHFMTDAHCAQAKLELAVGDMYYRGVSRQAICQEFGITGEASTAILERMGFEDRVTRGRRYQDRVQKRRPMSDVVREREERRRKVADMHGRGVRNGTIAITLRVGQTTVRNDLRALGLLDGIAS